MLDELPSDHALPVTALSKQKITDLPGNLSIQINQCVEAFSKVSIPVEEKSLIKLQQTIKEFSTTGHEMTNEDAWDFFALAGISTRVIFKNATELKTLDAFYDVEDFGLQPDQIEQLDTFTRYSHT